jgi:hypothetical protein
LFGVVAFSLKFFTERKAREQGRSLSNYILWLIQRDLDHDDVEKSARKKPRHR